MFPAHGRDAESLIAHADAAMYRAKGMGGNRYSMFEPSMETVTVDRLSLEHDLRNAVDGNELELRYQPIVTIETNEVVGCEALVRWRHPVRGLIPPDTFIGIAEETGTIVGIDRWVLREACAAAARMRSGRTGILHVHQRLVARPSRTRPARMSWRKRSPTTRFRPAHCQSR